MAYIKTTDFKKGLGSNHSLGMPAAGGWVGW